MLGCRAFWFWAVAAISPAGAAGPLAPSPAEQAAYAHFKALDRDMDMVLSAAELAAPGAAARLSAIVGRPPTRLDRDGDGLVTLGDLRPSLAGNRPILPPAFPAPEVVEPRARVPSCWIFQGDGRWVELPSNDPTCRMRRSEGETE